MNLCMWAALNFLNFLLLNFFIFYIAIKKKVKERLTRFVYEAKLDSGMYLQLKFGEKIPPLSSLFLSYRETDTKSGLYIRVFFGGGSNSYNKKLKVICKLI